MLLNWKEEMTLKCPYCGHIMETTAYLNIEDSSCDKCNKNFEVELHVESFTQKCIKKEGKHANNNR